MRKKFFALGAILVLILTVFGGVVAQENPQPASTTITILHINDIHGRLDPFTPWRAEAAVGGIARIATLVNRIRAEEKYVILLDAGDTLHGTNLVNLFFGKPAVATMNRLGVDAMVVGNHDFNFGIDVLAIRAEEAKFPILGANVRCKTGEPVLFLPPYIIIERGGLTIGVIGLVTEETPLVTHPKNVEGLEFLDPVTVTQQIVEQLEPKVDLIILLTHLSVAEEEAVLRKVPGIAVVVSGHIHQEWVIRSEEFGHAIRVQAGEHGRVLGRLDITVVNGIVTSFRHEFLPISPAIEKDPAIDAILTPFRDALGTKLAEVVGEAAIVLDGARANVRTRETNLGNIVTDILRVRTGADIAIQNSGGIRASIDIGPITLEEIFTVLPFDNYIVVLELRGEKIRQALENGVSRYPDLHGRFPQVSGLHFTFDPTRPVGARIVDILIAGEPIDPNRIYTVATNCFLRAGGDGYTMFKEARVILETGDLLRDAVAAYIRTAEIVHPKVEGRIRRASN